MEITKREIIVSIAIISVMLVVGFFISGNITDYQNDKNAEYQKAVKIEDPEMFQYGMDTNIGNAFIYGDLAAVDPVSFDEIGGEYLYVEKVEEHYNRHTRTVTKTKRDSKGKTHTYTETEVYYSWDYYDSWIKHSKKVKFCDVPFDYEKIDIPSSEYINTIEESADVRFAYYGIPAKHVGTIYTQLLDNTISDNTIFYKDCTIEEVLDIYITNGDNISFWIIWIILIGICIYGFYYMENKWLDD